MRSPCCLCVNISSLTPESRNSEIRRDRSVSACVSLLLLLSNGFVKKFPQQPGISESAFFYVVLVVSKESKRIVLPRTFCFSSFSRPVYCRFASWIPVLVL
jgi:hypothetical protein